MAPINQGCIKLRVQHIGISEGGGTDLSRPVATAVLLLFGEPPDNRRSICK